MYELDLLLVRPTWKFKVDDFSNRAPLEERFKLFILISCNYCQKIEPIEHKEQFLILTLLKQSDVQGFRPIAWLFIIYRAKNYLEYLILEQLK